MRSGSGICGYFRKIGVYLKRKLPPLTSFRDDWSTKVTYTHFLVTRTPSLQKLQERLVLRRQNICTTRFSRSAARTCGRTITSKMLSRKTFDDDPFFAGHREHMAEMERMFREPFGMFPSKLMGIEGPSQDRRDRQRDRRRNDDDWGMMPSLDFGDMFGSMRRMMDKMQSQFESGARNPDGHVYSHSSFASYSKMGDKEPKMFQATSSTSQAPGGVRETRRTLRDSESGLEKMAVGHHIGDRGHVIQRQRNRRTGQEDENQEYLNIQEGDAQNFDREWQEKTRGHRNTGKLGNGRHQDRAADRQRALPSTSHRRRDY